MVLQLLFVLTAIIIGARLGGIGLGVMGGVGLGILVLTGYVANAVQSEMTLMGIKAAMTLYPGVALGIAAIILYFFYGLTDDKFKKIADDLNHGKWEHGTIE